MLLLCEFKDQMVPLYLLSHTVALTNPLGKEEKEEGGTSMRKNIGKQKKIKEKESDEAFLY